MSIAGGVGANTGGAVSVTSGVASDDSGSMTIATANSAFRCQRRHGADNRGGLVYGGTGNARLALRGAISLSVGDGNTGAGGATVTVTAGKTTADSAAGGAR